MSVSRALSISRGSAHLSSPLPPQSGGEGSGVGGLSAGTASWVIAALPPTPDPSPPRARARGGRGVKSIAKRCRSKDEAFEVESALVLHCREPRPQFALAGRANTVYVTLR